MIKENEYGTAYIQKELLNMMMDFHKFCSKCEIKYSLCAGTLLGAIRHNGFIPWDDDMDVMIDRENFKKLMHYINGLSGYTIKRKLWIYRVQKINQSGSHYVPTIDIFILDNVPDTIVKKKLKILMIKILQGMMKEKPVYKNYSCFHKVELAVTYNFGRLFSDDRKYRMYEAVSQIGNKKNTKYVTAYNDLFKLLGVCYDKETMSSVVLHQFEDVEFFITEKWDSYLRKKYGNYMTPPKKEDRIAQHI